MFDKPINTHPNLLKNVIINTPNLQSLDNNACMQLISRHLQARRLEGRWQAVKHDCARPHIRVVHDHKTRQSITSRRKRYD